MTPTNEFFKGLFIAFAISIPIWLLFYVAWRLLS